MKASKNNFRSVASSLGITTPAWILSGAIVLAVSNANADVIFDNTPAPLPGNLPSLGYEATQTAEFGNEITFAGTDRNLTNVQIIMSDWALQSDYPTVGDATGFDEPITLNFYNPGSGTSVGSVIASKTETVHVPWHTANGFNGTAFPVNFDFTGTVVPDTVTFGVAYNTADYGYAPIGTAGPYNSLNYGLATVAPTIGTDVNLDDAYWNTTTAANYADGGAAGVGIFREDTGWGTPYYSATIQVTAVPEPASAGLMVLGGGAFLMKRRRSATASNTTC